MPQIHFFSPPELPTIIRANPCFVRVVKLHFFEDAESIGSQVLLIDNPFVANDKGFHPGDTIVRWRCCERKPSDHCSIYNKIHCPKRGSRALALQDLEKVSMVRLASIRVALR